MEDGKMKQAKRIVSLLIALTMVFGIFAFSVNAKGKAAPISLDVKTSESAVGYTGIVTVTVTVKNTSGEDVKNIVITSCGSTGLCMYRPIDKNVVITNPGYAKPLTKKDATTTCLKPGGTIKYVYCVLLGYQYAKRIVPEATRKVMLKQHKLLHTKDFREIAIKGNYLKNARALCFGDVKTCLDVKAYYNVKNSTYDKISDGMSVIENSAVKTSGNVDNASSAVVVRRSAATVSDSINKAATSNANSNTSSGNQDPNRTVYITPTGDHYHYIYQCGNGKYSPITLAEAKSRNYTPCDKCVHD